MNVIVLGASNKPDRFSYKAVDQLLQAGHTVFPVHPIIKEVLGQPVYTSLDLIKKPIDTITLYVAAQKSTSLMAAILTMNPRRLIFNPGAENPELEEAASDAGIQVIRACTLVMLSVGEF